MTTRDDLAALLDGHGYRMGSQGRFCLCGATGRPSDSDMTLNEIHAAHLVEVITAYVEAEKAKAWDEGWVDGWMQPNPYRAGDA